MEDFTIRLFDLLEAKSFEELTPAELAFVLEHMTEEEYRSHSQIREGAAELEYEIPEALPLVIAEKKTAEKKPAFWNRSIPIYQALAGAACIAFLVIVLLPREKNETTIRYASIPVDSVIPVLSVNNAPDTILRFVEVVKFHEKLVRDTITLVQEVYNTQQRETRMLEGGTIQYPSVAQMIDQNISVPLSEDRTAGLLPKMISSEGFGGR